MKEIYGIFTYKKIINILNNLGTLPTPQVSYVPPVLDELRSYMKNGVFPLNNRPVKVGIQNSLQENTLLERNQLKVLNLKLRFRKAVT